MNATTTAQNLVIVYSGDTEETVDHTHLLEWTLIELAEGEVDFANYAEQVYVLVDGERIAVTLDLAGDDLEAVHTLTAYDAQDEVIAEWEV